MEMRGQVPEAIEKIKYIFLSGFDATQAFLDLLSIKLENLNLINLSRYEINKNMPLSFGFLP